MTFAELFRKHLTAKPSAYGAVYEAVPVPSRVLELGVKAGGSLLAWAERWPDAEVYGLDVSLALVRPEVLAHPRVHLMLADATAPPPTRLLFDLIVDDVGHTEHLLSDQLSILRNYAALVAPGGTYVVEDICTDAGLDQLIAAADRLETFVAWNVLHPPGLEFRVLSLTRRP